MEQYREILKMAARQELRIAVLWSVVLVALIVVFWVCRYFSGRKLKTANQKGQNSSKLLRQSTWAAVVLTGICLVIGLVLWGSAVNVRRDIRNDLAHDAYDTYTGVYYIEDYSSISKFRIYDRWTTVDFEEGEIAYLYVNSPVRWLQTEYGTFDGTVVYGHNSSIVVDMQEQETG